MLPTLNHISLNVYATDINHMYLIRERLWNFNSSLFSIFTDKSKLIPNCFALPFKINTTSSSNWNITYMLQLGTERWNLAEYVPSEIYLTPLHIYRTKTTDYSMVASYYLSAESFNNNLTNSYIDYPTITSYDIYLPFFGYQKIDYKYLKMGLKIEYYLDFGNGNLVCNVEHLSNDPYSLNTIRILELNMNVGNNLIISGADYGGLRDSIINATFGTLGSIVGASIPSISTRSGTSVIKGGNEVNSSKSIQRELNPSTNRLRQTQTNESVQTLSKADTIRTDKSVQSYTNYGVAVNTSINALGDLLSMRAESHIHSANETNTSFNFINRCFLKISRPKIIPNIYNDLKDYQGRPTRAIYKLNQCNGYVQVGMIHLNITAPFSELQEIEDLLHTGVIINNPTAPEIVISNTSTP